MQLKVRFAPSPTGLLHIGNARTALFNALLAQRDDGCFLLRIEDTDLNRGNLQHVELLIEDMRWLGLLWSEGIKIGGPNGPYMQSERLDIYSNYYKVLEDRKHVYQCFCTESQLALDRIQQLKTGKPPRYLGTCANLTNEECQNKLQLGLKSVLRFRVPQNYTVQFHDIIRGPQCFTSNDIGDFIIRRADGTPQFFFANALDDALMGVTHVIRGDDHLSNTPRQLMLLEAMGLPAPIYAHLPLITSPNGVPLSKRLGDVSIYKLRHAGYFPEAIHNYLSRLGHTYNNNNLMNLRELASEFQWEKLSSTPAIYDEQHLIYWQEKALQCLSSERLWLWMGPEVWKLVSCPDKFITTVRWNILFPVDAIFWAKQFFGENQDFFLSKEAQAVIYEANSTGFFDTASAIYCHHTNNYALFINTLRNQTGLRGHHLFQPLRAAITGMLHGPELSLVFNLLKPSTVYHRLLQSLSLVG